MSYNIHLNFLPLQSIPENLLIYRKERLVNQKEKPETDYVYGYTLPIDPSNRDVRQSFWISMDKKEGYEAHFVNPYENIELTKSVIFWDLLSRAREQLSSDKFSENRKKFIKEIYFPLNLYNEGSQGLAVQPYYLKIDQQFGLLVDFQFKLDKNFTFSRKIQQLSLTLDGKSRRNLNYYVDRITKTNEFIKALWNIIGAFSHNEKKENYMLRNDFYPCAAFRLRSRMYLFNNGSESRSQFNGLKEYGPLRPLTTKPTLLFVFREQDRDTARKLAMALKGSKKQDQYSFPGFNSLFKADLLIDGNPMVLKDFSLESSREVLARVRTSSSSLLPIFILPDREGDGYLEHKAIFAENGIPTQACTLQVIQDDVTLRWSVPNIALQIFCKAGGWPWKVQSPTTDNALIIGISQSHKLDYSDGKTIVDKHFAFSVLTDSSGLFQKIQVLSEQKTENTYFEQLKSNLKSILNVNSKSYQRIVIHTSFKLKYKEISAIEEVVSEFARNSDSSDCKFAVVKVNHKHRYFGFNREVNSLVPYEGTVCKLGDREYLVWFEGIYQEKPTVTKAFPGPTHIEFLKIGSNNLISDDLLLQDLMNLSGANWRGFNAKSAPVSIFYCHLVADIVHDFQMKGLPMPAIDLIRPWFI
ncbi:Piwi domain-containing protein [Leptospira interrogans]|uniref:Piwi domain-containing protein n=1 Tax=Leptospira interrogans TaxID=173 RepID=UPI0002BA4331|nr:Piwi domain-containing protein [Leptospira interrogans]EMN80306.1 piwi domain protein [Leptospira interrogans serovar Grippotyphosa str. UI 12764]